MKGFFNFETITFLNLARKFTLTDGTGTPVVYSSFIRLSISSCVVMPIFTSPGITGFVRKINYSVFHIVVFLEIIVQLVFVCNEIKNSFKFAYQCVAVLADEYMSSFFTSPIFLITDIRMLWIGHFEIASFNE